MTTLRAPTHNPTPCEVRQIDTRDGITRLALAMDTTRSACRWFTVAELNTANHPADVLAATKTAPKRYRVAESGRMPFLTEYEFTCAEPAPLQGCALPPRAIVLCVAQSAAKSINRSLSLNTKILVFADVSLFHQSMYQEAA